VLSVLGRGRLFGADKKDRDGAFDLATSGQLAGAHLLLVEDNDINREFAGELLRSEGIVVDEAHDGLDAVEKVQLHAYDAVLMDVQMPRMDGLEAARRIRALGEQPGGERYARLPIIAMTALAMAKDAEQSRAAGMNDHVTKPIAPDRLMAVLAKWVPQRAGGAGAVARLAATGCVQCGELPADLAALGGVDAGEGVRRIGGKPDAYRRQLHRFAEHYRDAVDELRRIAAQSGPEQAGQYCHALKGVVGNLGAQALFEQVAAAEACFRQGRHPDEAAFDRLRGTLQQVVAEIDGLGGQASSASGVAAAPLGPEQLRALIDELDHALRYDLGAAEALVETLRGAVAGTPLAADVAALAERIDVFDLDAALTQLHRLQVQRLDDTP